MVSGANRHPLVIQDRPDVVGMDSVNDERDEAGFLLGRPDDRHAGKFGEGLGERREQRVLVSLDGV